jgi:tetratricopeptide (TPR) repeat protein/predicted Ser/Thr protein kinase
MRSSSKEARLKQDRTLTQAQTSRLAENLIKMPLAVSPIPGAASQATVFNLALEQHRLQSPRTYKAVAQEIRLRALARPAEDSARPRPGVTGPPRDRHRRPSGRKKPVEAYLPKPIIDDYVRNNPEDDWGHFAQGAQFSDAGDQESAYESYKKAIELGGSGTDLLVSHAASANAIKRSEEALLSAEKALLISPRDERALAQRMFARSALSRTGKLAAIERRLEGKLAEEGSGGEGGEPEQEAGASADAAAGDGVRLGYRDSKRILRESEQALAERSWERAAELAGEAIRADPENAPAYNRRARAYNRLGRYPDAVSDAQTALALGPAHRERVRAYLHWALAYNRLQNYEEASESAREALRLASKNPLAKGLLAWAEAGRGNRDRSLRLLEEGARSNAQLAHLREQVTRLPEGSNLLAAFESGFDAEAAERPAGERSPVSRGLPWWWAIVAVLGGLAAGWRFARAGREETAAWTPPPASAAPEPRETAALDGFETLGRLGSGGMGVVELARDRGTGRLVALKRLRDEIRRDPRERERIVREARIVAKLSHAGIVSVFEVRESGEDVVVVFEHVEGRSLSELLSEEGRIVPGRAAEIVSAVAEAVDHAHSKGVVHRDLKPSNVMIDADGAPRVMDFGIARVAQDAMTRLTGTSSAAGTPPYMAPEQEEGLARRESDVFALGVCLYEMLTGELPFPGMGFALHLQKREGRFVPVSQRLPGEAWAARLDAVFAKALDPDPAKRYPSAKSFAEASTTALTV